jgi:hypothetical protein
MGGKKKKKKKKKKGQQFFFLYFYPPQDFGPDPPLCQHKRNKFLGIISKHRTTIIKANHRKSMIFSHVSIRKA